MSAPPPLDARTVPAAVAAWAVAFGAVVLPVGTGLLLALLAGVLGLAWWARVRWRRRSGAAPGRQHRWPRDREVAGAVALALATVALVLLATAGHVHARGSGLLAELVPQRAVVTAVGTVSTDPQQVAGQGAAGWGGDERRLADGDRVRVRLQVQHVAGRGQHGSVRAPVLVLGPGDWAAVDLGQEVRVRGRLVPADPGDDVVALLIVTEPPTVTAAAPAHQRLATSMRAGLVASLAGASPQARGLVPGIAVGDDTAMPADLDAALKAVSLTHITAVSGAHVAIVLGAVLGALTWTPRWCRASVGVLVLVGFVVLVRPEASVLRSATMGTIALLALLLGRPSRALPALGAAVVVLLVLDPWLARSYGFVLSVLATGGLVVLAGPWAARLAERLPRTLAHLIAVPAAAQVCCAPVIILLEPAIATYAVPANVLAAAAVPPATILGVLATVCAPWWPAATAVLVVPAGWATTWIAGVATVTAGLPAAQLPWLAGGAGALLLALLTVLALFLLPRAGGRWTAVTAVGLVLVVLPWPRATVEGWLGLGTPGDWVAAQCDVGQGSSFVVRTGPRSAVMLDVGPPDGGAGRCLDDLGVEVLDLLVLSHLHADHVGGLEAVVTGRRVERVLLGPHDAPAAAEARVSAMLEAAGVTVERPVAGQRGSAGPGGTGYGEVEWSVLWPAARAVELAAAGDDDAANDLSLVVLVRSAEVTVLAPGDIEPTGQQGLLRSWPEHAGAAAASPLDVVLVPHHGSAAQVPELAAALRPRLAIVSVGADNDFGHPATSALAAYRDAGALVLRTDECGAVTLHRRDGELTARARCSPP